MITIPTYKRSSMTTGIKSGLLFLLLSVFAANTFAAVDVLKGTADPAIISDAGGWSYVFATGRGIKIIRSKDLLDWHPVGRVFEEDVPAWAKELVPGSRGIWAPDISKHYGKFWLYYSVSTFGSRRSCIGLATNKSLDPESVDYNWIDHGLIIASAPEKTNFNAIDPAAFTDEGGLRWLTWGSHWDGIKLIQLDPATGKPHPQNKKIYSLARRLVKKAIEAPFIIYRDGLYYLFVAFDRCCDGPDSTYKTMVGRSDKVTGPYLDIAGRDMLDGGGSLVIASHDNWAGPGHNSILPTEKGDYLVHHTYDTTEQGGARNLQIRPLIWNENGWPLAAEPLEAIMPNRKPLTATDLIGTWNHSANYGSSATIELTGDGKIKNRKLARWSFTAPILKIEWPRKGDTGFWIDTCYLAPDGGSYIGRNQTGTIIRGIKQSP
jgi:arabinan endo-1,5-alpha-L-arabinosidase